MTLISSFILKVKDNKVVYRLLPLPLTSANDITVVIPIKDNQEGLNTLLKSIFEKENVLKNNLPGEILVVDDHSKIPLTIPTDLEKFKKYIRLMKSNKNGPSAARNIGWRNSNKNWILFVDSDCVFTKYTIEGYLNAKKKCIAYAGNVKALSNDRISKFYNSQETLIPYRDKTTLIPAYIITANCLISKNVLEKVKGFNEIFVDAAGEDIDLGLRIGEYGEILFLYDALILHNYENNLVILAKRFFRYGKSVKMLQQIHKIELSRFVWLEIKTKSFFNLFAGLIMNISFNIGLLWVLKSQCNAPETSFPKT